MTLANSLDHKPMTLATDTEGPAHLRLFADAQLHGAPGRTVRHRSVRLPRHLKYEVGLYAAEPMMDITKFFEAGPSDQETEWTARWHELVSAGDEPALRAHVAGAASAKILLPAALEVAAGLSDSAMTSFANWLRGGFEDEGEACSALVNVHLRATPPPSFWLAMAATFAAGGEACDAALSHAVRGYVDVAFHADTGAARRNALDLAADCANAARERATRDAPRAGWRLTLAGLLASRCNWVAAQKELEEALSAIGPTAHFGLAMPLIRDLGWIRLGLGDVDAAFAAWDGVVLGERQPLLQYFDWVECDADTRSASVIRARQMLLLDGDFGTSSRWGAGGLGLIRVCSMLLAELLRAGDVVLADRLRLGVERRLVTALEAPGAINPDDIAVLLEVAASGERRRLLDLVCRHHPAVASAAVDICDRNAEK